MTISERTQSGPVNLLASKHPGAALRNAVVPLLLLVSGAAGLGYQIVWIRILAVGLGHEAIAMLAVLCAFLAGLAIGAAVFDRRSARTQRPGLWYAGLECLIGIWALVLWLIMPMAGDLMIQMTGPEPSALRQIAVAGGIPFLLLAPATIPMGATLPFAERFHVLIGGADRSVGLLYASNVLGAAVGAAATLTLFGPRVGFSAILPIFAVANLLCAAATLALTRRQRAQLSNTPVAVLKHTRGPLLMLFITGLLGIGFEVIVVRAAAQTLENTVYSYTIIICLYLAGSAAGAGMQSRLRIPDGWLLGLLGTAVFAGAMLMASLSDLYGLLTRAGLPGGWSEVLSIACVFLPASVLMGALFASLAQAATAPSGGLGNAIAVNLLGGATAPLLVGLVLVPVSGTVDGAIMLALGYGLLSLCSLSQRRLQAAAALLLAGLVLMAFTPPALVSMAPGERVLRHVEAGHVTATVLRDYQGDDRLVVDGRFAMGGDRTENVDRLQGHLPLLLHPAPRTALFLGLGSGATAAAAAAHPDLTATAVELARPVVEVLPAFEGPATDISAAGIDLKIADARRFVRASSAQWDVIIADTFHPARDGAALLYTVEHFEAVHARLAEGGLFAQWVPLHQFDLPMLQILTRSYLDVFPDARLFMANANLETPLLVLVGTRAGHLPDLSALQGRVASKVLAEEAGSLGLDGILALLGGFIAGPQTLADFAGLAARNTDDLPRLLFDAPASVYSPMGPASERLMTLLDLPRRPGDTVRLQPSVQAVDFAESLLSYWEARDLFIALGARSQITGRARDDAMAIAPALLQILDTNPAYAPARRPILAMALTLAQNDRDMALELLDAAIAISGHRDFEAARDALGVSP